MTPNQMEMLSKQNESSTIKMTYKFAQNQTSLNNVVQQLGSVESLFESPECIAEIVAKHGGQVTSGGESEEEATNL